LLIPAATKNLADIGKLSAKEADVIYHFSLVEPTARITTRTAPRSDAFGRIILRLLRIKTERVETPPPANRIDLTKNPVEIWIYGSGACLTTETSYIARR